ncbi:hypothetical protein ACFL27_13700 [candidate division CSSED10-310 bacterium]|uniref:Uncharacterized protein n=1 Tax=candidate division CSSED10-310 bacterium TaxID=2855610 RepID=A0ABV6YYH5_UNCC1
MEHAATRNRRETFILHDEHVEILEDLIYHVRKKANVKLNKSEIIRALIFSLQHKKIKFEGINSEEAFLEQISR